MNHPRLALGAYQLSSKSMSVLAVDVERAFTIKGRILSGALLAAIKDVENRTQTWREGWYALHTGCSKPDTDLLEKVHTACANDSQWVAVQAMAGRCPEGSIAGLVHICHALPVANCSISPWASGPICHVISKVLVFEEPVLNVKGFLGTWKMTDDVARMVREQVPRCAITKTGAETGLPRDDDAIPAARAAARQAKKKDRAAARSASSVAAHSTTVRVTDSGS